MRIAIVGGGVIALLTAVKCVWAGHEVVLVDQAEIPFSGATSFDRHRVTRALHRTDPAATSAAVEAHYRWIALQELLSVQFYEQVGALSVLPEQELARAQTMLTGAGSQATVLSPADLAEKYPMVRFSDGKSAVFESHAGVLLADRVLAACAGWLRWHAHAELHPHRKAVEVDVDRATVRLADGEVIHGDSVLVAAGPWSPELLLPQLAEELLLNRQSMLYCEVPDSQAWSGVPPMLSLGDDGGAWLVPPVAGTPLKLSAASACRTVARVGDNTTPEQWRDQLIDKFAAVLPGFHRDWVIDTRDCYYLDRASTGGPMLTVLSDRVLSFTACGGSSFKFAPLIAQCLAERLTRNIPTPTALGWLDRPCGSSHQVRRQDHQPNETSHYELRGVR